MNRVSVGKTIANYRTGCTCSAIKSRRAPAAISALVAFSGLFTGVAFAEEMDVPLGWGNITPCSKVEWNNNGFAGLPSPTLRTAEQRVYASARINAPDAGSIQNDLQQCAVQGVSAAGLTAIIASPGAAMPAFAAQFGSCLESRGKNYSSISLNVSEGQCMW